MPVIYLLHPRRGRRTLYTDTDERDVTDLRVRMLERRGWEVVEKREYEDTDTGPEAA